MDELALLQQLLLVGAILFGLGLLGFISRRNLIVMFLSAELMLQGVSVSLVAWGRYHNDWGGQMLVIFIITVAACEAAIAMAMVLMLYKRSGNLDVTFWQSLREPGIPPYVDSELGNLEPGTPAAWPKLTPAGIEPQRDKNEQPTRPHI